MESLQRRLAVARGDDPADLVVRGGRVLSIPFEHEPNRGFLRALHALARAAQSIGEQAEYERCSAFLRDSSQTAADSL